jgi:hypothetical protein
MMTVARLEKQERWELYEDGSPTWARALCGKRNRDGAQRCSGCVAWLHFGSDGLPDFLLFEGMWLHKDGVWRPSKAASRVYRQTGVLTEPNTALGEAPGQSHLILQRRRQLQQRIIELGPSLTEIPRAECPRCHAEQDLLDADDLTVLRTLC